MILFFNFHPQLDHSLLHDDDDDVFFNYCRKKKINKAVVLGFARSSGELKPLLLL